MSITDYDLIENADKNPELIFGFVAPIGTDAVQVAENLKSQLLEFGIQSVMLRLSDYIEPYSALLGLECQLAEQGEYQRIESRIKAANEMYRVFNARAAQGEKNALLALATSQEIHKEREKLSAGQALLDRATICVTFKRPEEVTYLRRIYGVGFHVIGVFATEEERVKHLHGRKGISLHHAKELVQTDEDDRQDGGQRTGDAFHMSDLFLDVGGNSEDWKLQLGRYLDLVFSHPYRTPTRDEQAMFMAHAVSLRSAQFGRQVGAAITTQSGDIVSVGCNEVPKAGGGQYWVGDENDERDHVKGSDSNDNRKNEILQEIMLALPAEFQKDERVYAAIKRTSLFGITEFGRAVHAEMEAILSCARKGLSPVDKILYTTTFPCHNCARHIIGAGIKRVVYIEPYPKSKAKELHDDAILLGDSARRTNVDGFVPFVPFVGISPRKYLDIFTVKPVYSSEVDRKLKNGQAISWQRSRTPLRMKMASISYIERETRAIDRLNTSLAQQQLPFKPE